MLREEEHPNTGAVSTSGMVTAVCGLVLGLLSLFALPIGCSFVSGLLLLFSAFAIVVGGIIFLVGKVSGR